MVMSQTAEAPAATKAERSSAAGSHKAERQRSASLRRARSGKKSRRKEMPQLASLEARRRSLERMVQHCEKLQAKVLSDQLPTTELLRLNEMYNSGVEDVAVSFAIEGEHPIAPGDGEVAFHPLLETTAWQRVTSQTLSSTGVGDSAWLEASLSQALPSVSAQQLDCFSANASMEDMGTPQAPAAPSSQQRTQQSIELKQPREFFRAASPGSARSASLSERSANWSPRSAYQQQQEESAEAQLPEAIATQVIVIDSEQEDFTSLEVPGLESAEAPPVEAAPVATIPQHVEREIQSLHAAFETLREYEERCEASSAKEDTAQENTQMLLMQLKALKEQTQRTTEQMQGELLDARSKLSAYENLGPVEAWSTCKVEVSELAQQKQTVDMELAVMRGQLQEIERQRVEELAQKDLEIEAMRLGVEAADSAASAELATAADEAPEQSEHPEMQNLRAAWDSLREYEERCETTKGDLVESKEHTQKLLQQLTAMKEQMHKTTARMQGELMESQAKLGAYEALGTTEVLTRCKVAAAELPHLKHFKTLANLEVEQLRAKVQEKENKLVAEVAEKERQRMDELAQKERQHVEALALKEQKHLDEVSALEQQKALAIALKDEEIEALRMEADTKLQEEQAAPVVSVLPIPEDLQREMTNLQTAMDALNECEERCLANQDEDAAQEHTQKLLEQLKEMKEQMQKTTVRLQGELTDTRMKLGAYEAVGSVEAFSRCKAQATEVPRLKQLQKMAKQELEMANLKVQEKERQRVADLAQKEKKHVEELTLQKRRGVDDLAKKDRQRLDELAKQEAQLKLEVGQRDAEIEALRHDLEEVQLMALDEEQAPVVAEVPEHLQQEMQNLRDALNKMQEVEDRSEMSPEEGNPKLQEETQKLRQQMKDMREQTLKATTQLQGELAETRKKLSAYEALGTTEALSRCKAATGELTQLKQFKKSANKELDVLKAKVQEKDKQRLADLAEKDRKQFEELAKKDHQRSSELLERDRQTRSALAEKDSEIEAMRREVETQRLLVTAAEQASAEHAEQESHGMHLAVDTLKEYEDRWDHDREDEAAKSEETTKKLLTQFREMREHMKKATTQLQGELTEVRKKLRAYQALGTMEVFARCKADAAENTELREARTRAKEQVEELRAQAKDREAKHNSELAQREGDIEALRKDVEVAKSATETSNELCNDKDVATDFLRTKLAAYEELADVSTVVKWRQAAVELREMKKFRNQVNMELDELRYQANSVAPLPENIVREVHTLQIALKRLQDGDRRSGPGGQEDLQWAEELSTRLLQQLQDMKQQMLAVSAQMRGELSQVRKKLGAYEALGTAEAFVRCKTENAELLEFKTEVSKELDDLRSQAQEREVRHMSELAQTDSEVQALRRSAAELTRSAAQASVEVRGDKDDATTSILRVRLAAYEELGDVNTLRKWKQSAAELRKMKRFRNQVNIELDELRFQVEELERERDELLEREQRLGLKYKQLDVFKLVEVSKTLKVVDSEIGAIGKQVTLLQSHSGKIVGNSEQRAFVSHIDHMMQQCVNLRSKVRDLLTHCVGDATRVQQQAADSAPSPAVTALLPAASAPALPAAGVGSARNFQSSGYPVPVRTS
mmetsp:Transcript_16715/g.38617  ORF Transcript_16715/g.38617 Transcript_16715/m.38617 type:complete len:1605 (-) Transcript_16715:154-4968(-)